MFCSSTSTKAWSFWLRDSMMSTRSTGSTKPATPCTSLTRMETAFMPCASTAESVAQQLEEQAKELQFGRLTPIFQFASLPSQVARQSLTMFSEQLPRLQSMFEDQWEDKWWPSGARRKDPAKIEAARRSAR